MIPRIGILATLGAAAIGAAFAVAVANWLKNEERSPGDNENTRPRVLLDEAVTARVRSVESLAGTDLEAAERAAASIEHKYHQAMALLVVANKAPAGPRARHLIRQARTIATWLTSEFERRDVLRQAEFVERKVTG